jgi:hypothetical protein
MDIAHSEMVEQQLTTLIERRHDRRVVEEGERAALGMWQESERRHEAARREENRLLWCEYHQLQAARHRATLEALAAEHEAKAMKLGNLKGEA